LEIDVDGSALWRGSVGEWTTPSNPLHSQESRKVSHKGANSPAAIVARVGVWLAQPLAKKSGHCIIFVKCDHASI
jgi:hypothetical protein